MKHWMQNERQTMKKKKECIRQREIRLKERLISGRKKETNKQTKKQRKKESMISG